MNILVTGANGQLGNEMRRVSLDSRNRYLFYFLKTRATENKYTIRRVHLIESHR